MAIKYFFTSDIGKLIFSRLHHNPASKVINFDNMIDTDELRHVSIFEATYVPVHNQTITHWLYIIGRFCQSTINNGPVLRLLLFWIHEQYFPPIILKECIEIL